MAWSEADLIERIQEILGPLGPHTPLGIGDDGAILWAPGPYVITTDTLVEDVHFTRSSSTPRQVGHKLLAVNLSDVAAMGAYPKQALISLNLPSSLPLDWVLEVYEGIKALASDFSVDVVGGNISRSPHDLSLSATVIGWNESLVYKTRKTAQEGDGLYLSGPVGSAALGLKLLGKASQLDSVFVRKQLGPTPRVYEGVFLGAQKAVTSLIDVSDGLLQDCRRLLPLDLGVELNWEDLPTDPGFNELCSQEGIGVDECLFGGEDYELLFTVSAEDEADFIKASQELGYGFFKLGVVKSGTTLVMKEGVEYAPRYEGFDHLKK